MSYFYGLVQQRGPWATTDVDILRLTQPRVTQSIVGGRQRPVENRAISGVLAGNAGYGMGASTRWTQGKTGTQLDSLNGIVPSGEGLPVPTTTPSVPPPSVAPSIAPKWDPVPTLPPIISRTSTYNPMPTFSDIPTDSRTYIAGVSTYKGVPEYAKVQNGPISTGVPQLAIDAANYNVSLEDYLSSKTGHKFDMGQNNLNWGKLDPKNRRPR